MSDGFIIGIVSGFLLGAWPWSYLAFDSINYYETIEQCEAELPRNQHCKLIAVPESEDG